jgi:phenylacetate-CoA ligase
MGQDMSEENMQVYIQKLREFKPEFMYSYPSALEILVRYMKRHNVTDIRPKAIFSGSENLYDSQRAVIEAQFGCKIFEDYGMNEHVVDAGECEQHSGYHVNMEYGILEIIGPDGEPITEAGKVGRIVGTGFSNNVMPLIRYATDDLTSFADGMCACERQSMRIQNIEGRMQEFIVTKAGHLIPFSPVYASAPETAALTWANIREMKIIQEREGELIIQMALVSGADQAHVSETFRAGLYDWLNEDDFDVKLDFVDAVARTKRGKIKLLEQKLPVEFEHLNLPDKSQAQGNQRLQ